MYFGTRRPRQRSSGGDVEAQTGLIMNSCLKDSFHMKQLPATCFFHGELRLCLNKWWFFQVSLLNWQMVPGSIAWKKIKEWRDTATATITIVVATVIKTIVVVVSVIKRYNCDHHHKTRHLSSISLGEINKRRVGQDRDGHKHQEETKLLSIWWKVLTSSKHPF